MVQVNFYIDTREHISKELLNSIPDAILTNLEIGDYRIDVSGETVLIIERKTINDYASSILDGRNREQKKRLISNYSNQQIVYLIEGDLTKDNSNFKYNKVSKETIISSVINTMVRDNIHVFHTSGMDETIAFLTMTYNKFKKQGIEFINKKSTHSEDLVNSVKINKKNNMSPEIVFQMMLNNIPGVSNTISTFLLEKFNNMSKFIETLNTYNSVDSKISYISSFKINNRSIPKSTSTNIVNCLFG